MLGLLMHARLFVSWPLAVADATDRDIGTEPLVSFVGKVELPS